MLDRSIEITLAGKAYRLWYGFRTQRRLGCRSALDMGRMVGEMLVRDAQGGVVDVDLDAIISVVWGGLHAAKPEAGNKLTPAGLSKDEVEELIATHIESSEMTQADVIGELATQIVRAVDEAHVFRVMRDAPQQTEAGEATDNPTESNPSAPSSSPPPDSE